jgi:tetratricopeptide (TPR) repeat protein
MELKHKNLMIMRLMKNMTKVFLCLSVPVFFTLNAFAQATINDGIAAFNKGLEERQAENYSEALNQFGEALKIANELGDEGEELKIKVETLLPGVHYQWGMALYNDKKIDDAIAKFKETIDIANAYGDNDVVKKASNALSQLYYYQGSVNYKQEMYTEALDFFNQSIDLEPDNVKAYYMIAAVYKGLDDDANVLAAAKKSAEMAKSENDNKYYQGSLKLGRDYFLIKANAAKEAKKFDEAIGYLKNSLEFDGENSTTYFLMVQIYSSMENWDETIAAAEKGLEFEKADPTDQAKFYYEMANAFMGKQENGKACDAYKKAAVGPYKESSEYQIEHVLKCE